MAQVTTSSDTDWKTIGWVAGAVAAGILIGYLAYPIVEKMRAKNKAAKKDAPKV
jgi:hypothetical protein